jgi:tetratricopeptide (TPR) repeat protein
VRSWTPLYLELGRVYLRLSQPDKALEALTFGRARRPEAEFSQEMARAWLAKEDWQQAAVALMEGMVLDPNSTVLAADLLEVYRRQAPQSCALDGSARIDMNCPLVHDQLCQASRNVALSYRQNGQPRQAGITARTAIQSLGCPAERFQ